MAYRKKALPIVEAARSLSTAHPIPSLPSIGLRCHLPKRPACKRPPSIHCKAKSRISHSNSWVIVKVHPLEDSTTCSQRVWITSTFDMKCTVQGKLEEPKKSRLRLPATSTTANTQDMAQYRQTAYAGIINDRTGQQMLHINNRKALQG